MTTTRFKHLCLAFICLLLSNTAIQSQTMIAENRLWSYYTDTGLIGGSDSHPTGYTTVYSFGASEVIDDVVYHPLRINSYKFAYEVFWNDTNLFMREDSLGRVYIKDAKWPEVLLYDFTIAINDVFYDSINDCQSELISIDSVMLLSGEFRERFNFANGSSWIRGIGGSNSLLQPTCNTEEDGLLCFQDGIDLEYSFSEEVTSLDCYFIPVSTAEVSPQTLSIFPNPVSQKLVIESTIMLDGNLALYNAFGQLILQEYIHQEYIKELDLSAYPSGVYYLEISGAKEKIIKQ